MLKRIAFLLGVLVVTSGVSSAAIIWDFGNPPVDPPTIAEIISAGGLEVGDKLFSDFEVITTDTVGTVAPGADAIKVTGVQMVGDYGLRLNGGWSAGGQEIADTTIHFSVAITEPWLGQGWLIKDNALWMTAFGVSGTGDGGIVSVSENVYAQDPNIYPVNVNPPLANKFVYYRDDTDMELYEEALFVDRSDPLNLVMVQLPKIWVIKDVVANGGDLLTGAAHLSEFWQTFSQIPEPATFAVLSLGGVLLLTRRRRRA